MKLARSEQEIIITMAADESTLRVYTDWPKWKRRMRRRGWKPVDVQGEGEFYEVPPGILGSFPRSREALEKPKKPGRPENFRKDPPKAK